MRLIEAFLNGIRSNATEKSSRSHFETKETISASEASIDSSNHSRISGSVNVELARVGRLSNGRDVITAML